jgi:hypothetical protein
VASLRGELADALTALEQARAELAQARERIAELEARLLSSCRYTVSVTWRLASPASRAIFSIAMPLSDSSETNVCRRGAGGFNQAFRPLR